MNEKPDLSLITTKEHDTLNLSNVSIKLDEFNVSEVLKEERNEVKTTNDSDPSDHEVEQLLLEAYRTTGSDGAIVLTVGRTGSGKSTTINALLGVDFEYQEIMNGTWKLEPKGKAFARMSHRLESETSRVAVFGDYCDVPGFNDTRGKTRDALTEANIRLAIKRSAGVAGIMVVLAHDTITESKGQGLSELFDAIVSLFDEETKVEEAMDSVFFVITHLERQQSLEKEKLSIEQEKLQVLREVKQSLNHSIYKLSLLTSKHHPEELRAKVPVFEKERGGLYVLARLPETHKEVKELLGDNRFCYALVENEWHRIDEDWNDLELHLSEKQSQELKKAFNIKTVELTKEGWHQVIKKPLSAEDLKEIIKLSSPESKGNEVKEGNKLNEVKTILSNEEQEKQQKEEWAREQEEQKLSKRIRLLSQMLIKEERIFLLDPTHNNTRVEIQNVVNTLKQNPLERGLFQHNNNTQYRNTLNSFIKQVVSETNKRIDEKSKIEAEIGHNEVSEQFLIEKNAVHGKLLEVLKKGTGPEEWLETLNRLLERTKKDLSKSMSALMLEQELIHKRLNEIDTDEKVPLFSDSFERPYHRFWHLFSWWGKKEFSYSGECPFTIEDIEEQTQSGEIKRSLNGCGVVAISNIPTEAGGLVWLNQAPKTNEDIEKLSNIPLPCYAITPDTRRCVFIELPASNPMNERIMELVHEMEMPHDVLKVIKHRRTDLIGLTTHWAVRFLWKENGRTQTRLHTYYEEPHCEEWVRDINELKGLITEHKDSHVKELSDIYTKTLPGLSLCYIDKDKTCHRVEIDGAGAKRLQEGFLDKNRHLKEDCVVLREELSKDELSLIHTTVHYHYTHNVLKNRIHQLPNTHAADYALINGQWYYMNKIERTLKKLELKEGALNQLGYLFWNSCAKGKAYWEWTQEEFEYDDNKKEYMEGSCLSRTGLEVIEKITDSSYYRDKKTDSKKVFAPNEGKYHSVYTSDAFKDCGASVHIQTMSKLRYKNEIIQYKKRLEQLNQELLDLEKKGNTLIESEHTTYTRLVNLLSEKNKDSNEYKTEKKKLEEVLEEGIKNEEPLQRIKERRKELHLELQEANTRCYQQVMRYDTIEGFFDEAGYSISLEPLFITKVEPFVKKRNSAFEAIKSKGNLKVIKQLIESGELDERVVNRHGHSLADMAARYGRGDVLDYLINERGVSVATSTYRLTVREKQSGTAPLPFHWSLYYKQTKVLPVLVKGMKKEHITQSVNLSYLNEQAYGQMRPFELVVASGLIEVLQEGIIDFDVGFEAEQQNPVWGNVLHLVVRYRQLEMLHYLLTKYPEQMLPLLTKCDTSGRTPLDCAAAWDNAELITDLVVDYGCPINGGSNKIPLLAYAVSYFHEGLCHHLLQMGASLTETYQFQYQHQGFKGTIKEFAKHIHDGLSDEARPKALKAIMELFASPPPVYRYVVYKGGGTKGLAYAGSDKAMKHIMSGVTHVAGASAGAMTATFKAVGRPLERLLNGDVNKILDLVDKTISIEGYKNKDLTKSAPIQFIQSFSDKTLEFKKRVSLGYEAFGFIIEALSQKEGSLWRIFKSINENSGLFEGKVLRKWLDKELSEAAKEVTGKAYPNMTLGDLAELVKTHPKRFKHLKIIGVRLNPLEEGGYLPEVVEFSSENESMKDYVISSVTFISCCIPGVFPPSVIDKRTERKEDNGSISHVIEEVSEAKYVDGGLIKNYPIDCFDIKEKNEKEGVVIRRNPQVLGLCLVNPSTKEHLDKKRQKKDDKEVNEIKEEKHENREEHLNKNETKNEKSQGISGIIGLLGLYCTIYLSREENLQIQDEWILEHSAFISNEHVGTLDVYLEKERKQQLVRSGETSVREFLQYKGIRKTYAMMLPGEGLFCFSGGCALKQSNIEQVVEVIEVVPVVKSSDKLKTLCNTALSWKHPFWLKKTNGSLAITFGKEDLTTKESRILGSISNQLTADLQKSGIDEKDYMITESEDEKTMTIKPKENEAVIKKTIYLLGDASGSCIKEEDKKKLEEEEEYSGGCTMQ